MAKPRSPFVYFTSLTLTNVKSFGLTQYLSLSDKSGRPARWTLLVGDNGVGKTTLLQCLALLRPQLSTEPGAPDDKSPDFVKPALAASENDAILALARMGAQNVSLVAELVRGRRLSGAGGSPKRFQTYARIQMKPGQRDFSSFEVSEERLPGFRIPLVVGYSAARHMHYRSGDIPRSSENPTESLFDPSIELVDAEEILQWLDYAGLKGSASAKRLLRRLKEALARILPDLSSADDVVLGTPATPGKANVSSGVRVKTPYGLVPVGALSLGYQTVTAWTVDLAWKLFEAYPRSKDPLQEPAIVLIDEIDLHLHPVWQRSIKEIVTDFFPQIQFVATAHSPLMAQSFLDENIVVLKRKHDHVEIESDPAVVEAWRVDEILTSDLFGLTSAYPPKIDKLLKERKYLSMLPHRSHAQNARLQELQKEIQALPTENSQADQAALDRLRKAARAVS
ncbi:MAG TPA: AAA family ATPase [Rhizomicrobium sp.]|nr:AAA family ATPase [Rhizomicrobium sp.]